MKRQSLNLHINELVIDGCDQIDPRAIKTAITQELSNWLAEKNSATSLSKSMRITHLKNTTSINLTTARDVGQQFKNTLKQDLKK